MRPRKPDPKLEAFNRMLGGPNYQEMEFKIDYLKEFKLEDEFNGWIGKLFDLKDLT